MKDEPRSLREVRPDCPPTLETAIMRMLAKDPTAGWPMLRDALPLVAAGIPADADSGRPALAELVATSPPTRTSLVITPPSPVPQAMARPAKAAIPTPVAPRPAFEPHAVVSVEVSPRQATIEVGTTERIRCRLVDAQGREVMRTPSWSSSAPDVASVDETGIVSGHALGTVTIAAMVDTVASMVNVEIVPATVARVDVEPSIVLLPEHGSVRLVIRAYNANAKLVQRPAISFRSMDPAVATVDQSGSLTAVKAGQTTAVVGVGAISSTIIVTVTPSVATALGIDPPTVSLAAGESVTLTATAMDGRRHPVRDVRVTWRSSAPTIARVDAKGRVTARRPGSATIIAAAEGLEARTELTVAAGVMAAVKPDIDAPAMTSSKRFPVKIAAGAAAAAAVVIALTAVALTRKPNEATQPAATPTTSAGAVASTPLPAPTTTATTPPKPGVAAPARLVTPTDTVVADLQLTDASPMSAEVGQTKQLVARVLNKGGELLPSVPVVWEVANAAIASVDSDGVLIAAAPGRTLVTARVGERTRVLAVDVKGAGGNASADSATAAPPAPAADVKPAPPPAVPSPNEAEAATIADSLVVMIERQTVRIAQLTKTAGDVGATFQKFVETNNPTAKLAGAPTVNATASAATVTIPLVLQWEKGETADRERTVNVEAVVEPMQGGWAIKEIRFPKGFTP